MAKIIGEFDRCDSCVQKAQYMAQFLTGDLLFCGHHFRAYEDKIIDIAVNIYDTTDDALILSGASDIQ